MDRLVVEGGKTVGSSAVFMQTDWLTFSQGKQTGDRGGIVRQKDTGYVLPGMFILDLANINFLRWD